MESDCIVSVIMPAYNAQPYITQCLDSLRAQTLQDIEVIVVDDGSTDATLTILRRFEADDQRAKVISQENQNAGAARNVGLRIARGKYLSILDADDFFEPTMLEKMVAEAEKNNSDVVLCRTNYYDMITAESSPWKYSVSHLEAGVVYSADDLCDHMFEYCIGWPWDKLFRKQFIDSTSLEFQSQTSTNDALFVFMALILASRISFVDEYLATHRVNDMSSVSNSRNSRWANAFIAAEAIENELRSRGLYEQYEVPFLRWVLTFILWNFETLAGEAKTATLQRLQDDWIARCDVLEGSGIVQPYILDQLAIVKKGYVDLLQESLELRRMVERLRENEQYLTGRVQENEERIAQTIQEIEGSYSYRLGRTLLTVPRVVRNRLQKGASE